MNSEADTFLLNPCKKEKRKRLRINTTSEKAPPLSHRERLFAHVSVFIHGSDMAACTSALGGDMWFYSARLALAAPGQRDRAVLPVHVGETLGPLFRCS